MSQQTGSGMGGVAVGVLCAVMALLASGCTALPEAPSVTTAIVDPTLLVVAEEARAAGALSAGLLASPVVVRVSPQPASEKRPPLVPLKQAESAAAGAGVGDVWFGMVGVCLLGLTACIRYPAHAHRLFYGSLLTKSTRRSRFRQLPWWLSATSSSPTGSQVRSR